MFEELGLEAFLVYCPVGAHNPNCCYDPSWIRDILNNKKEINTIRNPQNERIPLR